MADSAFKIIGRCTAAALCALAVSVVHAQPPHADREAWAAAHAGEIARAPNRPMGPAARPVLHGAPRPDPFVTATNPYAHGGARVVRAPAIEPATVPFRPVSDEARALAREGGAAYLRAGSIRADIARYNEEREANRPLPRSPNEQVSRPPQGPSLYRN
jgi:hypothetical protein